MHMEGPPLKRCVISGLKVLTININIIFIIIAIMGLNKNLQ